MASPVQICVDVLMGAMGMTKQEAQAHAFTAYIAKVENKANRARWAYPLVYIALGVIFVLCLHWFVSPGPDKWSKLMGAILGVFSALLAFWKPGTEVT